MIPPDNGVNLNYIVEDFDITDQNIEKQIDTKEDGQRNQLESLGIK